MKKYLFVSALAALLVFAFAAVAGAKYAGYAVDGSLSAPGAAASSTPGYLSWGGATKLMSANGVPTSLTGTAHGGYVTTTTKCAVCHSVHRATGAGSAVGIVSNQFLTNGGASCEQCHTTWGASTATGLPVEWAAPEDGAAGPHTSHGGCTACHQGGIHGAGSSAYWGMNAFLLGGANDAQIATELPYQTARQDATNQVAAGTALVTIPAAGAATTNTTDWFVNGTTSVQVLGGTPGQTTAGSGSMSAGVWAAQESLVTGYTCAQPGCHTDSVFANVTWGQTYAREQLGTGTGFMMTTGHSTAPGANSVHNGTGCGPCHPGNAAGGYRYAASNQHTSAYAYGCTQCHDAVGAATNSVAFPHGNRNIEIYQWNSANATPSGTIMAQAGNIWMYASNIAQSVSGSAGLTSVVDPQFTLIQGAVGPQGEDTPGPVDFQGNPTTVSTPGDPGNIVDGVCLKCHVPIDAATYAAYGVTTLNAGPDHSKPSASSMPTDITTQNPYNTTNWMYMWR